MSSQKETHQYCNCCGAIPSEGSPLNVFRRYWESDDGWLLAALCPGCWEEDFKHARPVPGDYAYREHRQDIVTGDPNQHTDLDPMELLGDLD